MIFLYGYGNAGKVATESNCHCTVKLYIPSMIDDGNAASLKDVIDKGYDLLEPYVNSSYVAIRKDLIVNRRLTKDLTVAIFIWMKSVPITA
ncbi:hypothetical protein A2U01_0059740, partial [Trifolium medium]|nr:hypothetical protein [Trifolium medium]